MTTASTRSGHQASLHFDVVACKLCWIIIIIIIIITTSAVIYGASHKREFTVVLLRESRSASGDRQLVGQTANLTHESACTLPCTEHSPIATQPFYSPSEGGRLSRPRYCSQCAPRAQSCVSQWFSWKHKLLSAARFEPGPSRAAGKWIDPDLILNLYDFYIVNANYVST